ncbi:MAG: hypothetical protein EXQ48_00780 [Acidobacteria bacterium]|nr:hypothetical protein [Acidobacteriota bacterium]
MERHIGLLAILNSLWGALAMLVGVSMLLLSAGAMAILIGPEGRTLGFAVGLTAGTFALIGVFAVLWGGAHLWAAARLRRHHASGRVLALGLAVVNLLILPFGTALGIYAMWVLLTNEGRRLFEPAR